MGDDEKIRSKLAKEESNIIDYIKSKGDPGAAAAGLLETVHDTRKDENLINRYYYSNSAGEAGVSDGGPIDKKTLAENTQFIYVNFLGAD